MSKCAITLTKNPPFSRRTGLSALKVSEAIIWRSKSGKNEVTSVKFKFSSLQADLGPNKIVCEILLCLDLGNILH